MNPDWMKIQRRLQKLGFNPGPIDGIRGRLTVAAVKRFQESKGLVADGIVGPKTSAALFEGSTVRNVGTDDKPWYEVALSLIGLQEDPRTGYSNPDVLALADAPNIDYDSDDIAWCGLFVAHCVAYALANEPLPTNPLGARNWIKFGIACSPQLGSVLVFWRVAPDDWRGHVGFYAGEDKNYYHVLGGNQSNSVSIARIPKYRLLGARWPITGGDPTGETVTGDASVALSMTEA